jgi:hypothetical protein
MTVGPGDFVKIKYEGRDYPVRNKDGDTIEVNRDENPFTIAWDSRAYVLEMGKETYVPFEAMMVAFGDPRSSGAMATVRDIAGNVMFILDRPTEVRRLRALYDNQFGDETEILYGPEATIEDVDGNEILSVLNDPTGESVTPVQQTVLDRDQLLNQLARQQRMIETLAQAQGIDITNPDVVDEPEPEPVDPFSQPPEDTGKNK